MLRQLFIFAFAFFALNASAYTTLENDPFDDFISLEIEQSELEQELFGTPIHGEDIISISSITVYELEEELNISFDTANHVPADFNALAGMYDIDWNTVALYELEEELEIGFDTAAYVPTDFNALAGMNDIDWNTVALFELEEELEIGFDTKEHLPENFNPYNGTGCEASEKAVL